ncbi:MAG TPA: hypothetical protein VHD31_01580 [Candidatus Paceibacterota bacterium]|nr:hypothetical protein [Candidatus Paceibacterota bacterium]
MNPIKRSLVAFLSATALLASFFVPVLASAQVYYNTNCYNGSNSWYWGQNCNTGSVTIYTQVNNLYGSQNRQASDFTFYVSGAINGQQYVAGSTSGKSVWVSGTYSVSVYNQVGYTPSYSSGCSGTITNYNQNNVCYVTLTSAYNNQYPNYPYQYQPYQYQSYIYTQPVTVVAKYVPTLPNTGFEPISSAQIAFAAVLLLAALALIFPYVRKALASILG